MSRIETFLYSLQKSFTSPSYYADILRAPFSFSLKYFLFYFFLYAVVGTVFLGIQIVPPMDRFLSVLPQRIESVFPAELEIVIKDGELSTNVSEPYSVPLKVLEDAFSDQVLGASTVYGPVENLLVIDTKGRIEDFHKYQTMMLLTRTHVIVYDKNDAVKMYSLDSSMDVTINRALVSSAVQKITPYIKYVVPATVTVIFLFFLICMPGYYQFYLMFFALLFWILSRISRLDISYFKSYQLGMHMCTITATAFGLLGLAGLDPHIPFSQTIILLVFSFFVLRSMKNSKETAVHATPPQDPALPAS